MKRNLKPNGLTRERWRRLLLGSSSRTGLLAGAMRYYLLTVIAFLFLYPLLYMITRSFMSAEDLIDTTTKWLPSALSLKNYQHALVVMDYGKSLWKTIVLVGTATILQVSICCMVGYGFARYRIPAKFMLIALLLLSYFLPAQTTAVPNYILFKQLNLINGTIKPFVVTAALGQGVYSPLCILVFYAFHRQIPKSLLEAAEIDGAGHFKTFYRIAVPMAAAGIVIVTLFSIVWYWNETYLVTTYLGYGHNRGMGVTTLMIELTNFDRNYGASAYNASNSPDKINDAYRMAGTLLAISPLLVVYAFMQRRFVQSIDSAGITGE